MQDESNLGKVLKQIIDQWEIWGVVSQGALASEYESLVSEVIKTLTAGASKTQVATCIENFILKEYSFDCQDFSPPVRTRFQESLFSVTEQIYSAYVYTTKDALDFSP